MSILVQNIVVLLAVLAAASFITWQAVRKWSGKKTSGCGQCGGCGARVDAKRAEAGAGKAGGAVVFLPVGNLRASKRLAK